MILQTCSGLSKDELLYKKSTFFKGFIQIGRSALFKKKSQKIK